MSVYADRLPSVFPYRLVVPEAEALRAVELLLRADDRVIRGSSFAVTVDFYVDDSVRVLWLSRVSALRLVDEGLMPREEFDRGTG